MSKEKKGYDGPKLHVVVMRAGDDYRWKVTLVMPDATGQRALGYRASGRQVGSSNLVFESGPEVHDEDRPVWTTMNATDRPDVRKKISDLVSRAVAKMKAGNQDDFELIK